MAVCRHFMQALKCFRCAPLTALVFTFAAAAHGGSVTNSLGFTGPEFYPIDDGIFLLHAADLDGEVIAVNTAIASNTGGNSGVAFSIPINMAKRVVRQLLEKGSVSRGYLGVQAASSFEAADAAKLGLDRAQGAWVETVYPNTPAAAAGLRSNDVILALDGNPVRTDNSLINVVSSLPAGQRIRLQVWRERKTITLDAVVGDWAQGQAQLRSKP